MLAPRAILSLAFKVLESSVLKTLDVMLWKKGILEAPPKSSIDFMLMFFDYINCFILFSGFTISLSTGIIIFSNYYLFIL